MSNEKANNLYPTGYVPASAGYPNLAPPPYSPVAPPSAPSFDANYSAIGPGQFSSVYGGVPPPPYQPYPAGSPSAYPTQPSAMNVYPQQPIRPYYPNTYPATTYANQLPPANVSIIVPDGFDASARFDNVSRPTIPPPPPGVAPNIAQIAMMSGKTNQVILGQKKRGWF